MSTPHPRLLAVRCRSLRGRTVDLAFCTTAGLAFLAASSIGGQVGLGFLSLAVMVVFGVGSYMLAGRNETAAGMFDRRDERWTAIDARATALSGTAVILAVLVGAFRELAQGRSGQPYSWLAAIGGVTYLVAFLVLRYRS